MHVNDHPISNLGAAALLHARMDHVESVENSAGRETVEEFWEKAVESKCEGLMIKVKARVCYPHNSLC
jgi:ATP-dependent DNA ligase